MAISVIKLFQPQVLGTSAAVIYPAPSTPATSVVKNGRVRLTNTSGAAATVTLYAVPSGGSPGVGNQCTPVLSIAANAPPLDVDIPSLAAGDTLQGLSGTANAITIHEMGGVLYS